MEKNIHKELKKYDKINDEYIKNIMVILDIDPNKYKEEDIFKQLNYKIIHLLK